MGRGRSRSRSRSRSSPARRRTRRRRGGRGRSRSSPRRGASRSRSRSHSRSCSHSRRRQRDRSRSGGSGGGDDGEAPNRIWVAHTDCARVIGRKGEARKEIESQSGAQLKIMREDDMDPTRKERYIELAGRPGQRRKAITMIMQVATFVREDSGKVLKDQAAGIGPRDDGGGSGSQQTEVLQIPSNEVGRLLGRGGENIRRIEEESGARLELDRNESKLQLRGSHEAVATARRMVMAEVTVLKDDRAGHLPPGQPPGRQGPGGGCGVPPVPGGGGNAVFKLWVSGRDAGKVIGRGGETVREFIQRSGCDIQVERGDGRDDSGKERQITLSGSPPQILEAFNQIARDVAFIRGEAGVIKAPDMPPQEAEVAFRQRGPIGMLGMPMPPHPGMMPGPGMMGMPPPGMMPPGMPPPGVTGPAPGMPPMGMTGPAPGMPPMGPPPGMTAPPGMTGPPGILHPPGMMPGMHPGMPPPGGMPPGGGGPPPAMQPPNMPPPGGLPPHAGPPGGMPPPQGFGGGAGGPTTNGADAEDGSSRHRVAHRSRAFEAALSAIDEGHRGRGRSRSPSPVAPEQSSFENISGMSFAAPWMSSKRPIDDWDEL